jgi:hypothetical protein
MPDHSSVSGDKLTPFSLNGLSLAVDTVCVVQHAISVHRFSLEELSTTPQALRDILNNLVPRIQPFQEDRRPS